MRMIYGGTFDPPHNGHIQCGFQAAKEIGCPTLEFLPCALSPLKQEVSASNEQRIDMLKLSCPSSQREKGDTTWHINKTELSMPAPSYTISTLAELRKKWGNTLSLCFLLGEDSLNNLYKWKRWKELINYCHLVVMPRQGSANCSHNELSAWIAQNKINNPLLLHTLPFGYIYRCNTPEIPISSSKIRTALKHDPLFAASWLNKNVFKYIKKHGIY